MSNRRVPASSGLAPRGLIPTSPKYLETDVSLVCSQVLLLPQAFFLTDWSFAISRQNIGVNYSKSLFHAAMGETLGDSLIDPESDSFVDPLSASTSQGKVNSRCGCWDTLGVYGREKLLLSFVFQVIFVLIL